MTTKSGSLTLAPVKTERFFRHRLEINGTTIFDGKINVTANVGSYGLNEEVFRGKRVLDIGCWSGGFSFYFEHLGADVLAIDVMDPDQSGFNELKDALGSNVTFRRVGVYDLSPDEKGLFDIVFFQGVFYHLKHPLLALEKINAVTRTGGRLLGAGTTSDTYFSDRNRSVNLSEESNHLSSFPLAFFVHEDFLGDKSNWWIPNEACCASWLKRSGYDIDMIRTRQGGISDSGEPRSSVRFVATKASDPEPEHPY